jgi:hypothetical protein
MLTPGDRHTLYPCLITAGTKNIIAGDFSLGTESGR